MIMGKKSGVNPCESPPSPFGEKCAYNNRQHNDVKGLNAMSDARPRTIVYVDGYNWYHAIFKHYPEWKWLNVQTLFEVLRPDDDIQSIGVGWGEEVRSSRWRLFP
jgi:hypothetical protein